MPISLEERAQRMAALARKVAQGYSPANLYLAFLGDLTEAVREATEEHRQLAAEATKELRDCLENLGDAA